MVAVFICSAPTDADAMAIVMQTIAAYCMAFEVGGDVDRRANRRRLIIVRKRVKTNLANGQSGKSVVYIISDGVE